MHAAANLGGKEICKKLSMLPRREKKEKRWHSRCGFYDFHTTITCRDGDKKERNCRQVDHRE
jgi:hypothetical protein